MRIVSSLLLLLLASPLLVTAETGSYACRLQHYQRYIDLHNEAFLEAAERFEAQSPRDYETLSDFIDFQIFNNTLKGFVGEYLVQHAPSYLDMSSSLAQWVPAHDRGPVHRLLWENTSYQHNYRLWQAQRTLFLERSSFNEKDWETWLTLRNRFNRLLASVPSYQKMLVYFRTPARDYCS